MIFQVDDLMIKIVFLTEQYCPLVFGAGKGSTDNIEIVLDFGDPFYGMTDNNSDKSFDFIQNITISKQFSLCNLLY